METIVLGLLLSNKKIIKLLSSINQIHTQMRINFAGFRIDLDIDELQRLSNKGKIP